MGTIGAELRKAREAEGKARSQVARDTGILIHHLAALEHGDFDELPDDETVAGFVRVYAEYLGFVPDQPVAEFWAERGGRPAAAAPSPDAPRRGSRRAYAPWVAAGAAAVLVVIWLALRDDSPSTPVSVDSARAEVAQAAPAPPAEDPTPAAEPATPAPEPAPAVAPAPTLAIGEHGVGIAVKRRRLIGESDRFAPGTEVWFWTRVLGGRPGDEVHHVWIREGREVATVTLAVGSANWRTQSAKTMFDGSVGRWAVEARDADGNVLARSEFACEP